MELSFIQPLLNWYHPVTLSKPVKNPVSSRSWNQNMTGGKREYEIFQEQGEQHKNESYEQKVSFYLTESNYGVKKST